MPVLPWKSSADSRNEIGELALRHLDAAYNLGRWLLGNDADAADAVHDAFVRATGSSGARADGNARAWWLAIVRNCCLARLDAQGRDRRNVALDQVAGEHGREAADAIVPAVDDTADERIEAEQRRALLVRELRRLPAEYREVLVLRDVEDLSYREIADVLQMPIGTVMSRLSRGRAHLVRAMNPAKETTDGL